MACTRVLLIGLDGVPLDIIERWASDGYLPTLSRLMHEGCYGTLHSTLPPTSGPSWSSFATGMNPGKTGIFDFLYRHPGTYRFPPVNASMRHGVSLWKRLNDAGFSTGVLNLPIAYPVEQLNGYEISGWMTPYSATDFTYPPELRDELEQHVGKYHIYPHTTFAEGRRDAFIQESLDFLELMTRSAEYLLSSRPCDVSMVVNFDTDRILHQMWHYLDTAHPWRKDKEDREHYVRDYFTRVDTSIERMLAFTDDETLVFVLSDHGMGRADQFIVLNNWLLETGFLKFKRNPLALLKRALFACGFTLRNVHHVFDHLGLAAKAEYGAGYYVDNLLKLAFLSFRDIDWSRSKAYSFGRHYGSIYLNVRGREPQGIVNPGAEYNALCDQIASLALDFRDPVTGARLIKQVLHREEIYHGACSGQAPDLVLIPADPRNIFFGLADFGHRKTVDAVYRYSGMHREDGMLVMRGPHVKRGSRIQGAIIWDIAPTVLHYLGQEVPAEMDGQVLVQAFEPAFLQQHPVILRQQALDDEEADNANPYSQEGEAEVMRRLEELGYLG